MNTGVPTAAESAAVRIRDVGPRDGLQPESPVSVEDRIRLIDSLQDAGVTHIEAVAFVSPKAVPAMAGAAEVIAGIDRRPSLVCAALVPNVRGSEMALEAGVDEITVTLSISETYNRNNVKMSTADSEAQIAGIVDLASASGVPTDAVISCAFGSPYEGDIAPEAVAALAQRLVDVGVTTITYADTTGMATPRRIDDLVDALEASGASTASAGLHLHDTRGLAVANALQGIRRGITRFDTSVGGLGGSPFAHGAGGNLATEQLVAVLDDAGIDTGIDLARLIDVAGFMGELVGRPVPSMVALHGPPRARLTPT